MPIPAYMTLEGNDGKIDGGSVVAGREGCVEVIEFHHEVRIPTDPDTGALTGVRKHEAFQIVKAFDKSSPLLYKAVCNGESFKSLKLDWYRIDEKGDEVLYFTHTLEDVKVSSVEPIMYNVKAKEFEKFVHMEKVSFRYAKIKWEYTDGGLIHEDSWNAGR